MRKTSISSSESRAKKAVAVSNKNLYKNGEYSKFFTPESKTFPFAGIYEQKRSLILERFAGGGMRILDIGGGRGRFSLPLSRNHRIIMADLSLQMIEEALQKQNEVQLPHAPHSTPGTGNDTPANEPSDPPLEGGIEFICCDAENPPFQKESFDALLAIDLLPHMKEPDLCIKNLFELVKPGGTVVIDNSNGVPFWMFAFPEYVNWKKQPIKFIRTFLHGGVLPNWADRIIHLTKDTFVHYLRAAGFVVIDFVELGPSYCPKWHLAFCRKPAV